MKRQIIIGSLALTLVLPSIAHGEDLGRISDRDYQNVDDSIQVITNAPHSAITVYIDGVQQEYPVTPFIENGSTLVPMRSIFEALGAEVKWIEHSKTVKATKKDVTVEIKIGSYFAKINDEIVKLDVQPKLVEGTSMVPLRFVSEALEADVEWEEATRTIQITKAKPEQSKDEIEEVEEPEKAEEQIISTEGSVESEASDVLTYEEAVKIALNQSYRLKNSNESIKRTEEVRDRLAESFMYSRPEGSGQGQADLLDRQSLLALSQTDVGLGMAKRQASITEEAIAFEVKNAMDEILRTQVDLAYTDLELKNTERQLELAIIRAENGLESQFNVNMARKALDEGKKQKEVLQKSLDKAYLSLNQLIGKKDEERYEIVGSTTFEPVKVIDLDAHVHRATSQDPYVWLQEQNIKQAELGLTLYTYNAGQEPYAAKEIDVRTEKNKLMDLKSKLEESIRSKYNDLEQLEKQYEVLGVNLQKAEDALNLVRTQYDAGMAIDAQLQEAELTVEKIKTEMSKLAFSHGKLKIIFNKPYLAPDYLN